MTRIVVGVDSSERSADAVAFARDMAVATGAELLLTHAFPYAVVPGRVSGAPILASMRDEAHALLARVRTPVEDLDGVSVRAIADPSPARALHALAEEADAELIVVGSSHRGPLRRVLMGTTATHVAQGSPCAIAVVPAGYAGVRHELDRIGCAFDTTPEAAAALDAATRAAAALHARLRVIHVFDAAALGHPGAEVARSAREDLELAVEDVVAGIEAEAMFLEGHAAEALADQSRDLDLLFAGSRSYGPARAVLVGGVTHRLLNSAACPVIMLPRGAEATVGRLFTDATRAGSR